MSDGQIVTAFEEWRKVHDELSQLRDKLAEIRKKGGWEEGVPEEEGFYRYRTPVMTEDSVVAVMESGFGDLRVYFFGGLAGGIPVAEISKRTRFARILTPEDLE